MLNMQTQNFSYKWWALIGLSLLSFTAFMDVTIVTTALPFIQKDLQATVLQLQWVMTIFAMIMCMFMISAGKVGDLFGRKKIFYVGFILFGIAAVGAANAHTIQALIFFRAIQGFAAAIIATIGVALLPQAFPAHEQMRAISVFSAFNGAGLALGPFIGGILITTLGWRWVFWINIPIIIVGLGCCFFSLQPSPKPNQEIKIDFYGLILLAAGLGSLIFGVVHGEQAGWNLITTWVSIAVGLIALICLVIVENKVAQPLLDLTLFKNNKAALATLVCLTTGFIVFVFMFFDSLYLQKMREQTPFYIGLTLLCVPVSQVFVSIFLEKLTHKFGIINLLIYGLGAALLAACCHGLFFPHSPIIFILMVFMLMGYTWAISNGGTITALTQTVPSKNMGAAIGTLFTILNVSGSISLALASVVFHWRESTAGFMNGFHWVAWSCAFIMLIILLLGIKLKK